MKAETRKRKEEVMLNAAIQVMQRKGLTNFTMEEIADEANVTKVTLYAYFTSKENLTMGVCYQLFSQVKALVDNVTIDCKNLDGLKTCMSIKAKFLSFLIEQPFRSTLILETILICNTSVEKLSSAMVNSNFRNLLNEKLPQLAEGLFSALDKGRQDGSIGNKAPNEILITYLWNCIAGYITLINLSEFPNDDATGFWENMNIYHEKFARDLLAN